MIRLEHVSKSFRNGNDRLLALNDVSLTLPDTGMVFLLGKSGSGKSTLLNLIGGLDDYEGKIDYGDLGQVDKRNLDSFRRANIGYVFQDFYLDEQSTVFENIREGLSIGGIQDEEEVRKRADSALKAVSLSLYKRRKASDLSLGQKQRVAIARAIAGKPKILLADEPTGNLDSKNGENVMSILKGLSRDILVLVVSHNEELAERFADVLYRIQDGKIEKERERERTEKTIPVALKKDIEKKEGRIGTIRVTLLEEEKTERLDEITILRKDGKTYIHLPEGFEVVKEEIKLPERKQVPEESVQDVSFDTTSFDDSKRGNPFFHKPLFRNMMSRKGNRILVIISLLLAFLMPICLEVRNQMYQWRIDSVTRMDRELGDMICVEPAGVYCGDLTGLSSIVLDPDSGLSTPYSMMVSVDSSSFDVLKKPNGVQNVNKEIEISLLSLSTLEGGSVSHYPFSLSLSSLSEGDILVDETFARESLSRSLAVTDLDDILGTTFDGYDLSGQKKTYTIRGFIENKDENVNHVYFAGFTPKDIYSLSVLFQDVGRPNATFALGSTKIQVLEQDIPGYVTPFASKALRESLLLYTDPLLLTSFDIRDTRADEYFPEESQEKVLYVPQDCVSLFGEDFYSGLFGIGTMFLPPLPAEKFPEAELVLENPAGEKQIGVYLSKPFYDLSKESLPDFPILCSQTSPYAEEKLTDIVALGYFEPQEGLPLFLEEGKELSYFLSMRNLMLDSSWLNNINARSGTYTLFFCEDAEKTGAYLDEKGIDYLTLDAYVAEVLNTRDIDMLYVAILLISIILLTLYSILFKTRLAQDEPTLAIYRALGLDRKVILFHYIADIFGKVAIYFILPYILVAIASFLMDPTLVAPIYVHVVAILLTYLLILLFVLVPLYLTLRKTPHRMLLKKDV